MFFILIFFKVFIIHLYFLYEISESGWVMLSNLWFCLRLTWCFAYA